MSEMAKSLVFTGVGELEIQEYPIPEATEDKVVVAIEACALCTWEQRVYTGVKNVSFPFIGGHEMCGKIIAMGDKVNKDIWKIGDRVVVGAEGACGSCYQCKMGHESNCMTFGGGQRHKELPAGGFGGMSSHLLVSEENIFHVGDTAPEEAAITEPLSCVIHSVETANIQFGETVLVIGCGIMGLLHTILAVKKGACVIVSDTNEERTAFAMKLGASHAINPAKEDQAARVKEITGGAMAQVVFDTTPIAAVAQEAIKSVSINGRLVLYSSFYPDKPVTFSPDWLHKSAAKIMGTANSTPVDYMKASRMIEQKVINMKPFVSEVYDLADYKQAFESAIKGDKYRVVIRFN